MNDPVQKEKTPVVARRTGMTVLEYIEKNLKSYSTSVDWLDRNPSVRGIYTFFLPAMGILTDSELELVSGILAKLDWYDSTVKNASLHEIPPTFDVKDCHLGIWRVCFRYQR